MTLRVCVALCLFTLVTSSIPAQSFEVASLRKHQGAPVYRSGPLTVSGPLVRLTGYTVYGLILDAYHIRDFQIVVAPGAVSRQEDLYDTTYDVLARTPGGEVPRIDDVRVMLRNLLAERFGLVVGHESKEMPVYMLTVDKGGPHLHASSQTGPCVVKTETAADGRNNIESFIACPVERLADRLTNLIGSRPVIDSTSLTGDYDFRLTAIPEFRTRGPADAVDIPPVSAVRDLGLKLTAGKSKVEILRIEHLGKLKEN